MQAGKALKSEGSAFVWLCDLSFPFGAHAGQRVRQQFYDCPSLVSHADRLGGGPVAAALGQAFPAAEPGLG